MPTSNCRESPTVSCPLSVEPYVQRAIADYLDMETGRIESLISKKRRMIELLQHRLVSLATQLVNGGDGEQESGIPSIPYITASMENIT